MAHMFDLGEILNGKLLVWRGALAGGDRLGRYRRAIVDRISTMIARDTARAVSDRGLESLHRHVSILDMRCLTDALSNDLKAEAEPFVRFFLRHARRDPRPIYYAPDAWMRFMAPESLAQESLPGIAGYYGHLVAHDPHRDSWFSQATNVVNLWIAVGRVSKHNGLLLYPTEYGKAIVPEHGGLPRSHSLPPPVRSALEPGDVLIFHGEHLHSSALNLTAETRVVLSFRFTVGRPRFAHDGERYRYRRLARPPRSMVRAASVQSLADRRATGARPTAMSNGVCAVRSSAGIRYVSSRCPHRGADLSACGHVDARTNRIRCAWHDVAFDLDTGASLAASVGPLKISEVARRR